MRNTIHSLLVPSILAFALGACSNDQPAKAPDNASVAPVTGDQQPMPPVGAANHDAGSSMMSSPSTVSSSPVAQTELPKDETTSKPGSETTARTDRMPSDSAAVALSDEQILQITHVANRGEIEQGKLAQSKAKDARVRKLAAMMIKEHADADTKGTALAKKQNLSLTPSPTSTNLESNAKDATRTLKEQSAADFDMTYVDTQVKEHQEVLDMIDQKLIPNAKSDELKAYLAEVRPKVAMHLEHAKDLQKQMEKP